MLRSVPTINDFIRSYPRFRYMGSKHAISDDVIEVFQSLDFASAADPFCGSGFVSYCLKALGKSVTCGDYLNFSSTLAKATIVNNGTTVDSSDIKRIVRGTSRSESFITETFGGIFFDDEDLRFLDRAWPVANALPGHKADLALSALCLAAARKQPRGVFTFAGKRYDDGRRHMRSSIRTLFQEAVEDLNAVVFDNGRKHVAYCGDAMSVDLSGVDLIYLDPPYAPMRDDNDYIKRYHFLEGLSKYWRGDPVMTSSKVRKLKKRYTPFAYRRSVGAALETLVSRYADKIIVLSYSSNAYPKRDDLLELLQKYKRNVSVRHVAHRYHFGTHAAAERRLVDEYIFVAT